MSGTDRLQGQKLPLPIQSNVWPLGNQRALLAAFNGYRGIRGKLAGASGAKDSAGAPAGTLLRRKTRGRLLDEVRDGLRLRNIDRMAALHLDDAGSKLIDPVVRFDFHLISSRGRELPTGVDEFTSFLKSYIATWAGRAGVL